MRGAAPGIFPFRPAPTSFGRGVFLLGKSAWRRMECAFAIRPAPSAASAFFFRPLCVLRHSGRFSRTFLRRFSLPAGASRRSSVSASVKRTEPALRGLPAPHPPSPRRAAPAVRPRRASPWALDGEKRKPPASSGRGGFPISADQKISGDYAVAAFFPAMRPKRRQSTIDTVPRRTMPCTPPQISPAA